MVTPSHKAFSFLASKFRQLARSGNSRMLDEFLATDKYIQSYMLLSGKDRKRIVAYAGDALQKIKVRAKERELPKYSPRVGWDAERIARLERVYNATGSDVSVAADQGISWHAARRARLRYLGSKAPLQEAA